jgi:hypothetical protein
MRLGYGPIPGIRIGAALAIANFLNALVKGAKSRKDDI